MRKRHSIKLQTARIYLIIQQAAGFTQHAPLSPSTSSCPHVETYLRRSSGFSMLAPWKAQGMTIRTARLPRAGNLLGRAGEDLSGLPDPASRYHFLIFFIGSIIFQFKHQILSHCGSFCFVVPQSQHQFPFTSSN